MISKQNELSFEPLPEVMLRLEVPKEVNYD